MNEDQSTTSIDKPSSSSSSSQTTTTEIENNNNNNNNNSNSDATNTTPIEKDDAESSSSSPTVILTPEEQEQALKESKKHKERGNELYRAQDWLAAIDCYSAALDAVENVDAPEEKAVYYCNRAACNVALEKHDDVIMDCTAALKLNNTYVKALLRRAHAYESLDKLRFALDDYTQLAKLEPRNQKVTSAVRRLDPIVEQRREQEKAEMLDKLKGMGNMLLGKFGYSLDNFEAVKDPVTGSYSISIKQK